LALTDLASDKFMIVRWGGDGKVLETIPIEGNFMQSRTGQIIVNKNGNLFVTGLVKDGNAPLSFNDELTFWLNSSKSMTFMAMYHDPAFTVPYVGIKEPATTLHNYTVYPNPATTTLHIDLKEDVALFERAEIYDLTGKQMGSYNTTTIPVSQLSAGMYIVKIFTKNNEMNITRFVKINDY
jgi:hypothetical protein